MTCLKRSCKVPVRAISREHPTAVLRSPGPRPHLEDFKNLIIYFCGIFAASGRRAVWSVTEMCGKVTYAWGCQGALPMAFEVLK